MSDQDDVREAQPLLVIDEDLVQSRDRKESRISDINFEGLLHPPLKLYENVADGCGGQLWPAGMVLSKYLLREPQISSLCQKRILELGAGSGLVGIAIALGLSRLEQCSTSAGAMIDLTDQLQMLPMMQKNIELNPLIESIVSANILDWGTPLPGDFPLPDVILAAECVYFEPAFHLLLQTLKDLIKGDTICYFCFKKRRRADLRFMKEARKLFRVDEVLDDPDRDIWSRENLFMYTLALKR